MWIHEVTTTSECGAARSFSVRTELDAIAYADTIANGRCIRCVNDTMIGTMVKIGDGSDPSIDTIFLKYSQHTA
ncbi:hypothetical protein BH762_gp014 [Gordonia phage OneUp]|uniref:Uncharacterized protein n=1 Tax=Gordonia phage OneUp TaxID=1838074 RepID=A0A160DHM8_9CAUD|nr:hypothetical protein BH762_gp014 [Gordonia phage OneUp]ANA86504.1 hypothetical protein PBI_ONEUP_171 [Gordonia phage OneUp]